MCGRGILILVSNKKVLLKMIMHDMYKHGVPRDLLDAIICVIQSAPQVDLPELVSTLIKVSNRFDSEIVPLKHATTPASNWPFLEHVYTIDLDCMKFSHAKTAGPYISGMPLCAFAKHLEVDAEDVPIPIVNPSLTLVTFRSTSDS